MNINVKEYENSNLAVVIYKPAMETQLRTIIDTFRPKQLTIFIKLDPARIDVQSVRNWDCLKAFSGNISYVALEFEGLSKIRFRQKLQEHGPFRIVAMPAIVGSMFWGNTSHLHRRGVLTINMSDGTTENSSIFLCFLKGKVKASRPITAIKACLGTALIFFFGRAQLCFHEYYPLYTNCFAKKSAPVHRVSPNAPIQAQLSQLLDKYRPSVLLIPGYEYPADTLANIIGCKSYIATTKGKLIILNGVQFPTDDFVSAEQLVELFSPELVVGAVSDAIANIKVRFPNLRCLALKSAMASNQWGFLFNQVYSFQTKKIGVQVCDLESLGALKLARVET